MTEYNTILQGDCLEMLRTIPSNSIDMTFADPPFNLNKKYNSSKDKLSSSDYLSWCSQWLTEMVRITKPTGAIFVHNIPKWLTYFATTLNELATFHHWIVWNAKTSPMGKSLQYAHYGILYYSKSNRPTINQIRAPHPRCRKCGYLTKEYGGKKYTLHPFGALLGDVWNDIPRILHRKDRDDHPCQLPPRLLERIILMATNEGDIVLDPFSGTGTTAIAAKRLGRRYIGIELDERYCSLSQEKLKTATDSKLGGCWVSYKGNEVATLRDRDWPELSKFYRVPENIDKNKSCLCS